MEDYRVEYVLTEGRHAGSPLYKVPKNYLFAMLAGHYPDEDLRKWLRRNMGAVLERQALPEEIREEKAEECGKIKYINKATAVSHMRWLHENSKSKILPVRAYECDKCTAWHLTSKEQ